MAGACSRGFLGAPASSGFAAASSFFSVFSVESGLLASAASARVSSADAAWAAGRSFRFCAGAVSRLLLTGSGSAKALSSRHTPRSWR
ncbi:hypothetical protein D3C87_1871130 [compost metagenome]